MTVKLKNSPCSKCPYREKSHCKLIGYNFSYARGVRKCYIKFMNSPKHAPEDFLKDLEGLLKQNNFGVSVKNIAKDLGLTHRRITLLMRALAKIGVVEIIIENRGHSRYIITKKWVRERGAILSLIKAIIFQEKVESAWVHSVLKSVIKKPINAVT